MVKKTSSVCDDPDQLENNNSSILLEMGYISTQTPHHDAQRWTKDLPDLPSTPSNISTLPKLRVDNQTSQAIDELTKADKLDESLGHIKVHGWMHKQGQRRIKGPIHKSWKRRYFALEGSIMYYFLEELHCRKFFSSRDCQLVVGTLELGDNVLKLEQSQRLDLPYRGIALTTASRTWILCPESAAEFHLFFEALALTLRSNDNNELHTSLRKPKPQVQIKRVLPNVRKYHVKGQSTYRVFYALFVLTAMIELLALVLWFPIGIQPCDVTQRLASCEVIQETSQRPLQCAPTPFNGLWTPPPWYLEFANVQPVQCFAQAPVGRWISYSLFLWAEMLSVGLGVLYYLGYWTPIRRGAQFLSRFNPPFPASRWPTVDVLLCHYSEPSSDTLATLSAIMKLDYPAHLLHVWICDDGYIKSRWKEPGSVVPEVTINRQVIENAGDVRQEVAQFMYDLVQQHENEEDNEEDANPEDINEWRKQHTSVKLPTLNQPRVVNRMDCALGSVRDDYKYTGTPHVTFVGRVKPRVHHSKAGNLNNVLYNEGANGQYAMILDNDMKPHKMFIQATLPFFFDSSAKTTKEEGGSSEDDMDHHRVYSDDLSQNQVGYVQTPQYFEDSSVQLLQLGDPCGHRNATFFDAVQTGMDGYDMASFAGTNAIFRRQALDSVCGIQYGSLTEDAFTGKMMVERGWKGFYFRKDFEGEEEERIRLAEGAIPESVAASLAQRKRWAKGNFQIFLRKKKNLIDPMWPRPEVEVPGQSQQNAFMRWVIFMNLTVYPLGSFPAIFFFYVINYFLYSGDAPIYTSGLRLLLALLPKLVIQSILVALSTRTVDNADVLRAQQTWFSYAFAHTLAVFEALYWKLTGKEASWANTGALGGNSPLELPNILVFLITGFGVLWAICRYFSGYDASVSQHGTPLLFASVFMGLFILVQLGPMVRMSVQEYFGWSHEALTNQGNLVGSLSLAAVVALVCLWVAVEGAEPPRDPTLLPLF